MTRDTFTDEKWSYKDWSFYRIWGEMNVEILFFFLIKKGFDDKKIHRNRYIILHNNWYALGVGKYEWIQFIILKNSFLWVNI